MGTNPENIVIADKAQSSASQYRMKSGLPRGVLEVDRDFALNRFTEEEVGIPHFCQHLQKFSHFNLAKLKANATLFKSAWGARFRKVSLR
jgi:hypothetical protein